jgi:hypothetical protein
MMRPDRGQLDAAAELLSRLATEHGLSNLRHGDEFGEIVADVESDRTYFDIVAFEEAVEGRLGWRPDVVPSSASGAQPDRQVGAASNVA